MAVLPSTTLVIIDDAGEEFEPGVVSSEMEKGLAKLRVASHRVVVTITATLYFESAQASLDFEDWYFNVIKRIGWFDWKDPRTGTYIQVRFKAGAIGKLQPLTAAYSFATRSVVLEYLR